MTRGSDPPTPAQWNLQGWLAAYQAAQRTPAPIQPTTKKPRKEDDDMDEVMTGGWKFEGKERPAIIRICPKCQGGGIHRIDQTMDTEGWCDDCKEGKPPPGHEPEGFRPHSVSKDQDAANLNHLSNE